MVNFQTRLKELRIEKGLTMKQLAIAVGVSEMAISRWERGERTPNIDSVIALANFFNVSVGYMAGVEN